MRVLFCTHRLPYAANRGDRIRALNLLRTLAPHVTVDLFSLVHDADEASHVDDLLGLAATVTVARTRRALGYAAALGALPSRRPFTHALLDAPGLRASLRRLVAAHRPDVVLAYGSGMARLVMEPPLAGIPYVLDMVDLDSEKWRVLGKTSAAPMRWIYASEARRLAAFERRAAAGAEVVLVVNERERAAVTALEPGARVEVVGVGVAVDELRPPTPPAADERVVFCGVMDYAPNDEAAQWLCRVVWPLVRASRPSARLLLVGARPTSALRALAAPDRSIEVTGTVDDVRPWLWGAAVSVAPLQLARGVQNKVLEAVAAGLPCVITPIVLDGLPREVEPACTTATTPGEFAEAICALLALPPEARRAVANRAALQELSWAERMAPVVPLVLGASQAAKRSIPSANDVAGL